MYDDNAFAIKVISIDDANGVTTDLTWDDLMRIGKDVPGGAKVVLASDSSSNGFSPLREIALMAYFIADPRPYGDEHDVSNEPHPNGVLCTVLYPAN